MRRIPVTGLVVVLAAAGLLLAEVFCTTNVARASSIYTPNTLGLSPRAVALANALGGDADDLAVHYFNPAGLALTDHSEVGTSYIYTMPRLVGGPVGEATGHERASNRIVVIGLRVDLDALAGPRLRPPPLGLGFSVAVDNNFRTMMIFDDMRSSNGEFDRWGPANMVMQSAIGVGLTPHLALGLGFHGGFRGEGVVETRADLSGETSNEGTRMRGSFHPMPLGGLYVHGSGFGAGATYREETWGSFESIDVTAQPTIAGLPVPALHIPMNFLDTYVPRDITLGAHWDATPGLRLLADGSWRQWSRYEQVAATEKYAGARSRYDTLDLWTPRAGVEWTMNEEWTVRGGYRFEQTPFRTIGTRYPDFGTTTRGKVMLDADTHVGGGGFGWRPPIGEWLRVPVRLDAAYQYHALVPRRASTSDGHLFHAGGGVHVFAAGLIFEGSPSGSVAP